MRQIGRVGRIALAVCVAGGGAARGYAETVSYTGTLASPEDIFMTTVTLCDHGRSIAAADLRLRRRRERRGDVDRPGRV